MYAGNIIYSHFLRLYYECLKNNEIICKYLKNKNIRIKSKNLICHYYTSIYVL